MEEDAHRGAQNPMRLCLSVCCVLSRVLSQGPSLARSASLMQGEKYPFCSKEGLQVLSVLVENRLQSVEALLQGFLVIPQGASSSLMKVGPKLSDKECSPSPPAHSRH